MSSVAGARKPYLSNGGPLQHKSDIADARQLAVFV